MNTFAGFSESPFTAQESQPDWLSSHVVVLEYYAGSTEIIVPDNLRRGVSGACRYDPGLNPSYQHNVLAELML